RAVQPSNRLEALHYFRDRYEAPAEARDAAQQALIDGLIGQRARAALERRDEAIALLDKFISEEPEEAIEMPDALLRLSELTWEKAREEYLVAFDVWQKSAEGKRSATAPVPDYDRTLALYDRIIEKHPDFPRLDLV